MLYFLTRVVTPTNSFSALKCPNPVLDQQFMVLVFSFLCYFLRLFATSYLQPAPGF